MRYFLKSNTSNTRSPKSSVIKNDIHPNFTDPYNGIKHASKYLQKQGISRTYRKQILESFDIRTIKLKKADNNTYGLRFYGGGANPKGKYLFETFSPLINRNNLALPYEWNHMTGIQQFKIKAGTAMITGRAAPQLSFDPSYIGGAYQWFIADLENLETVGY